MSGQLIVLWTRQATCTHEHAACGLTRAPRPAALTLATAPRTPAITSTRPHPHAARSPPLACGMLGCRTCPHLRLFWGAHSPGSRSDLGAPARVTRTRASSRRFQQRRVACATQNVCHHGVQRQAPTCVVRTAGSQTKMCRTGLSTRGRVLLAATSGNTITRTHRTGETDTREPFYPRHIPQ